MRGRGAESATDRLIEQAGLAEHRETIQSAVVPGWKLLARLDAPSNPGDTKVGGMPGFVGATAWPRTYTDRPMTFLAQIVARDLPMPSNHPLTAALARDNSVLSLFADLGGPIGSPSQACARISARREPVASTDRRHGSVDPLSQCAMAAELFWTLPEVLPPLRLYNADISELAERYRWLVEHVRVSGGEHDTDGRYPLDVHHFLGEPLSVQDDVRTVGADLFEDQELAAFARVERDPEIATPGAWQALLGLATDERFDLFFGAHIGLLHVIAPRNDIAECRLDRLVCTVAA